MRYSCIQSRQRLYISTAPSGEMRSAIFQNHQELKGAGIRYHPLLEGVILNFLGLASKVKINDKIFYLNNKSFSKFVLRTLEMQEPTSLKTAAINLQTAYQKRSYNRAQVLKINRAVKKIFKDSHPKDFQRILNFLNVFLIDPNSHSRNITTGFSRKL